MSAQNGHSVSTVISDNSIAVLPFRNMSPDPENEYFSDGITEEIINALTRVKGLSVIARTSSFSFKGQDIDLRDIGARLRVAYILEGSVRKSGNTVRVTAQLVKAADGFHVFSEVYDRELKDIFEVQDDISNKIVQKLSDNLGINKTIRQLVTSSTDNIDAYELYLKGRFSLSKGSLEATEAAIQYFEAALKKDKNFVLPMTGLAACYTFLGGSGLMTVSQAFEKADEYARRTNLLDESVAETHLAMANSFFWQDWDFQNTALSIKKAIHLSPGTSSIHDFNSLYLMAAGKLEDALVESRLANKLDPLSLKSKCNLGELYYRTERYIEAIEIFDEILAENAFFKQASILKAWSHLFVGDFDSAISIFGKIPVTAGKSIIFYGGLAFAYYKQKKIDKVLECLRNFKTEVASGNLHWLNYNYSLIFLALGEKEKMYESLEKSLREKITPLIFINADPVWNDFRKDREFHELIEKSFVAGRKDKMITIKSETKEVLQINLRDLLYIEAQENYSKFVWLEGDQLIEKLLRITLKNAENQIVDEEILRCHRSFIINSRASFTIHGNSNGYLLKSKYFKETIPISRSLGKEIVSKLLNK